MNTMDAHHIESNTSIMLSYEVDDDKVIDYGYEEHGPDTRRHDVVDVGPVLKIAAPTTTNNTSMNHHPHPPLYFYQTFLTYTILFIYRAIS